MYIGWDTASCTHKQPTGHSIKKPRQSQLSQKCIIVKGLGNRVHTHKLDRRDIQSQVRVVKLNLQYTRSNIVNSILYSPVEVQ